MKQLHFTLLLMVFSTYLMAQRDQTIFNTPVRVGGFGGPIFHFVNVTNDNNLSVANGGGGGLIIGDIFLGGYGLGNLSFAKQINGNDRNISIGHGGLWIGVTPVQHLPVHPYFSLRAGRGVVDVLNDNGRAISSDGFFILHPEGGVELNLFRWFRVAGTVGYQFFNSSNNATRLEELDLNNLNFGITLRFGAFGRK